MLSIDSPIYEAVSIGLLNRFVIVILLLELLLEHPSAEFMF